MKSNEGRVIWSSIIVVVHVVYHDSGLHLEWVVDPTTGASVTVINMLDCVAASVYIAVSAHLKHIMIRKIRQPSSFGHVVNTISNTPPLSTSGYLLTSRSDALQHKWLHQPDVVNFSTGIFPPIASYIIYCL